ncbi:MFS transporter [Halobacillus litoralis]|uniref:MFS transporter n=1 Tax=Halobacillus litoralis TaxID=45668 RepID=UPI00249079D2|nr:MFS transporter [Halobacillus litoralis]
MYKMLWKNRNIRFYLLGGGISRLGDVLTGMAFLFLAYELTGSKLHTTGIALAETIPYLLFGLIGGVVADTFPRKKLLISLDLLRVPLMLAVIALHYFNALTYPALIINSFLIQTIGCFFNPAHRAVLPMVTKDDERASANSMYDTVTRGITILTPVIAIWLLNTFGVIHFFTVDAFTYLLSVWCLSKLYLIESPARKKTLKMMFLSIYEFGLWIKKAPTLRMLFLFTFYTVFLNTWVWQVGLLLSLSELSLHSEELYSGIQGVFGGVVILTNLILPSFIKNFNLRHYLVGALIWGSGICYYGLLYEVEHFFIGCILVGIGLPIASLSRVYLIQKYVPESKMGRAFSTNAVLLYASNTLSLVLYGLLSTFMTIRLLMIGSGLMIMMSSITFLLIHLMKVTELRRRFMVHFLK